MYISLDWSSSLYSNKHGLIVIGGENKDGVLNSMEQLNMTEKKWTYLTSMNYARFNHSSVLFDSNNNDELILTIGCGHDKLSKTCEVYSFNNNKWTSIQNMSESRENSGICYWKQLNKIIVVGGWNSPTTVESYDLYKNKWYNLPELNDEHTQSPHVWIQKPCIHSSNGLICVAGNIEELSNDIGCIEIFDPRDNISKWKIISNINSLININNNNNNNNKLYTKLLSW